MTKERFLAILKFLPHLVGIIICAAGLIIFPKETAEGIKNGLILLGDNIIPSLFPFMVLSSFVSSSSVIELLAKLLEKPSRKIFRMSGNGSIAVLLGLMGGYPIGAKCTAEFFTNGRLTENEANRLFFWCINPGPAFVITAVGNFMLSDFKAGILLYVSNILSAVSIGFCTRFFCDGKKTVTYSLKNTNKKDIFVNSVSTGSEAMLGICGWVLTFSAIGGLCNSAIHNENLNIFINTILEVTTGCTYAVNHGLPLPLISAILGFGGFAVFFQVRNYMDTCHVSMKTFLCIRLLNSALSAFFCSRLIKLFPQSISVFSQITVANTLFPLSHSIIGSLILIIMCIVFIFEVDNKRKMC